MPKITPCLWFDSRLQEAMDLYTSIFPDSRILGTQENAGVVFTARFELFGQEFMGLNGAPPTIEFTDAISLYVDCEDQAEVDKYWDALLADGGRPSQCGWLSDKFGVSWQIVPRRLIELINDPDPARAKRAMDSMMRMVKIEIAELERAANG